MQTATVESTLIAARKMMKAAEYCFFVTVGKGGLPSARLMQPYDPEEDLTIWFGAHPNSRKVHQLEDNKNVTLAFLDPNSAGYVTLNGEAVVVNDLSARQKYWRVFWTDIYPGGPEGDEYTLIKFTPKRLEIMSYTQKALPEPYGMKPQVLVCKDKEWEELTSDEEY